MVPGDVAQLRKHMRDRLAATISSAPADRALRFRGIETSLLRKKETVLLDLVHQAAEVIKDVEQSAIDVRIRAQDLAGQLQLAQDRIEDAERDRQAAETKFQTAKARIEQIEEALIQAEVRMSTIEAQLSEAELRASMAEARANDADGALERLEGAIRTQLLGSIERASRNLPSAA